MVVFTRAPAAECIPDPEAACTQALAVACIRDREAEFIQGLRLEPLLSQSSYVGSASNKCQILPPI